MCDESKDRPPAWAGWAFIAAYSAAVFASGHYSRPFLGIMGDAIRFGGLPLAENTYQRPEQLEVRLAPEGGKLRVYLTDMVNGKQVEIRKDMRPPAVDMAKTGFSRASEKLDEWLPKGSRKALEGMVTQYITGS